MAKDKAVIAGIDEVGRGCIVGSVIAAAVILDAKRPISGLTDSKKLTPYRRQILAGQIKAHCVAWSIGRAEASEIDAINILQASLLAMSRAYTLLKVKPERVMVDGNHFPRIDCEGETVVQGDLLFPEISAASILAKVARDYEMQILDRLFPGYDIAKHKGYPTKLHIERINTLGVSCMHRKSYAPVKKLLAL